MKDSEKKIVPLTPEQRGEFPSVIYRLLDDSMNEQALIYGAYVAMRSAGYKLAIDFEKDKENRSYQVTVRTANDDRHGKRAEAALVLGLVEATRQRLATSDKTQNLNELYQKTYDTATELIGEFTSNPEAVEEFNKFYGGLRWSSDKERFISGLFTEGTDFDAGFVHEHVDTNNLTNLVYSLNLDISYDERDKWRKMKVEDVFKKHPELDYRRLADDEFRNSPEGTKLEKAYARLSGEILQRATSSLNPMISKDGVVASRPVVPLSRFPIIEALMTSEVSIDRPREKYDMGPSDVVDIILYSDSKIAHEALIKSVTTKIDGPKRMIFDGPSEFQHKRGVIRDVLRAYKDFEGDETQRTLLKEDLLSIVREFTSGDIVEVVRQENQEWLKRTKGEYKDSREVGEIKEIVVDFITFALSSADMNLIGKAEEIIYHHIPFESKAVAVENDPFALDRATLMLALIDSLELISENSKPEVLQRVGTYLFVDNKVGEEVGRIAKLRTNIKEMQGKTEVVLAWQAKRDSEYAGDAKKKTATDKYDEVTKPIDEAVIRLHELQNDLFLGYVQTLVGKDDQLSQKVFKRFTDKVILGDYHMRELPHVYFDLIKLAETDGVTDIQKNNILSHISNRFEDLDDEAAKLMVPVILDICRVALGPVDAIRMPTKETRWGLYSATSLVQKHRNDIFKVASKDQLQTLDKYVQGIREIALRVAADQMLPTATKEVPVDLPEWKKTTVENISEVYDELKRMAEHYEKYLHMEDVKVEPHIYYPWMLKQLAPFWQKMNWEVGDGNAPSRDIRDLYRVLEDHVRNKLVLNEDEYKEGFDAVEKGALGTLLYECYTRMVVPHDIKYNGTVWNEGLSFMHSAVAYMPQRVFDQLETKYKGTEFIKYVQAERVRWNKE